MVYGASRELQESFLKPNDPTLSFRIRGTSRDGQIVHIRSPKCVIGSDARSTMRLLAKGVRPVHCLVLRGEGDPVVRCWSADTRLNGGSFREARLKPGDCLGIGPIELEVLPQTEDQEEPIQEDSVSQELTAAREECSRLQSHLAEANQHGRQRAKALIAKVRELQDQLVASQKNSEQWMPVEDRVTPQLSQEPNREFEEQIDRLERERGEWEEQKRQMEAELSEMSGELHEQEHLLSLKSLEMQQRREEFLILRRKLEEDHILLKSQKAGLAEQAIELSSAADTNAADVNSEPSTYEQMKAKLFQEDAPEGNSPGDEQSDGADSSSMHETETLRQVAETDASDQSLNSESNHPKSETQEENDEVDIDEYMRSLLSRNHGGASIQPVAPSVAKDEQKLTPSAQTAPGVSVEQSQPSGGAKGEGSDLSKKRPLHLSRKKGDHRREPIVDQSNLSAMRDLANQSSQAAIAKYASKRLAVSAAGKGVVCFTGLLSGCLLLFWGNTALVILGALVAFSVAGIWVVQAYMQLKRTGMISTRRNVKSVRPAGLPPEQGRPDRPKENE